MKCVLISIRPEWCEKIASGAKTVEVRKTKPKLEPPFKVYIYCTSGPPYLNSHNGYCYLEDRDVIGYRGPGLYCRLNHGVIGEFICHDVEEFAANAHTAHLIQTERIARSACIPMDKLAEYGYKARALYGWNISDLKIYEHPKNVGEFFHACDKQKGTDCSVCLDHGENRCKEITRPPQSWCYVEEVKA